MHGFAPAKINLFLHLLGRQPDGYHRLSSLIAFADIGDRIRLELGGKGLRMHAEGPFATDVPLDPALNTAAMAAQMFLDAAGKPADVSITLVKNLPVASGIGGGSADAAAVLRLLAAYYGIDDMTYLQVLARKIGADVPMCLVSRPALVGGVGDELNILTAFPACGIMLVNPRRPLQTARVFRDVRLPDVARPFLPAVSGFADFDGLIAHLQTTDNDLATTAMSHCPAIRDILNSLAQTSPAHAGMSGSGATCFALFDTPAAAQTAAAQVMAAHPEWWVDTGQLNSI